MRLPLCYPIESRDGTLNADSKMKNMVAENVEGELVAVKRPGVTNATDVAGGLVIGQVVTGQGMIGLNGQLYVVAGDKLYGFAASSIGSGSGSSKTWVQI